VTCAEVRSLLHRFSDGALPEAPYQSVERHLSGCAPCQEAHRRVRAMESLLGQALRVPEPSMEFWTSQKEQILERLGAASPDSPRRSVLRFISRLGVAAAAGLLALTGLWVFRHVRRNDPAPAVAAPGTKSMGSPAPAASAPVAPRVPPPAPDPGRRPPRPSRRRHPRPPLRRRPGRPSPPPRSPPGRSSPKPSRRSRIMSSG
jgi:anti-sigma factor RsiW